MRILILVILFSSLLGCYKEDDGVLNEGTLIEYRHKLVYEDSLDMLLHNVRSATMNIDGKQLRISMWKISYIDKNNLFGVCNYYTIYGTSKLQINTHIKCSDIDDIELNFN